MEIKSKLPHVGTTIFTVMSALANECGAINLSQGFPNFDCPDGLKDWVHHFMQQGFNQYAPMPGVPALRRQLALKMESLYGLSIDPDTEITITAGATQALFCAIAAVVRPGDEVIIFEPAYDSYLPVIELNGGLPRSYAMKAPDYSVDWDQVGRMINSHTRMIITNNPHNPSGSIFRKEDLQALEKLIQGRSIIHLSDEVYEHLVFDKKQHESVLRYPGLYRQSMLTFSFGKTFHNTGWKMGYCVGPDYLMREFRKVHQFNVFSVNTPIQHALARFLEQPETYLGLSEFYQQKRDFFHHAMKGARFRPLECSGTYFQLFDYSQISDLPDTEFAKWMTREHGVATIPVSVFYQNPVDERVVRVCFAKTEDLLAQAAAKLKNI